MKTTALHPFLRVALALAVSSCASFSADTRSNSVSMRETAEGWRLLFDGKTTAGWTGMRGRPFPKNSWAVENGMLRTLEDNSGGDIMFVDRFKDFELMFDWRIAKRGNSGVKYLVQEEWISFAFNPNASDSQRARWLSKAVGLEYQILDDEHYGSRNPTSKTGALYLLYANEDKKVNAPGLWNNSRIVVRDGHGEHWLNGEKLFEFKLGSKEILARVAKTKFRQAPGYGNAGPGYIVLTHHNSPAWFRNIKIRELRE